MPQELDKDFWEAHWQQADAPAHDEPAPDEPGPNPHLVREIAGLAPGTAMDAGCGEGTEAIWLADQGWQVTATDISTAALARAAERARAAGVSVGWTEADLGVWEPAGQFDLVTTHYAHPAMPQLAFYERIAEWVAPGGTLLIVGHLHSPDATGHAHAAGTHGDQPFDEASVTVANVAALLDAAEWDVVTAEQRTRTLHDVLLRDAVVRAIRR